MSTPLPISKLVAMIGDENIQVQNVAHNMSAAKQMKDHARLTICTSPEMGQQMMRAAAGIKATHVGLILWLPAEKVDEINAANPITQDGPALAGIEIAREGAC